MSKCNIYWIMTLSWSDYYAVIAVMSLPMNALIQWFPRVA